MPRTLVASFVTVLLAASAAQAVPPRRPPAPARPAARPAPGRAQVPAAAGAPAETLTFDQAVEALHSADAARVLQGLDSLSVLRTRQVVPPIVELLRNGPGDEVTDHAVEQLGNIGLADGIDELSQMLHHRRPSVRLKSVQALAKIADPRVTGLIESALHDSDPEVRGEAARSLGAIGARASVPLLFRAFERGVPEAAEAIGILGEPSAAVSPQPQSDREDPRVTSQPRTLAMWLGRAPLGTLLRGFNRFLRRRDVPAAIKTQIVIRLEQQASGQIREFLQQWVSSLPATYHGPDRQRAELAIQQIRAPGGAR